MSEARSGPEEIPIDVYEVDTWIIAIGKDLLYRRQYAEPQAREQAVGQLAAGKPPREVFGWTGQTLPVAQVLSVEWVPAALTVLVRRGWWRDPWRLACQDGDQGERLFENLIQVLPDAGPPAESRVGPHDLALDPRILLGVVLALAGFFALVGGALEGIGQAPVGAFEWLFRLLGRELGLAAVLGIGGLVLAAGVGGLIWWYLNRPRKIVVRRSASAVVGTG